MRTKKKNTHQHVRFVFFAALFTEEIRCSSEWKKRRPAPWGLQEVWSRQRCRDHPNFRWTWWLLPQKKWYPELHYAEIVSRTRGRQAETRELYDSRSWLNLDRVPKRNGPTYFHPRTPSLVPSWTATRRGTCPWPGFSSSTSSRAGATSCRYTSEAGPRIKGSIRNSRRTHLEAF